MFTWKHVLRRSIVWFLRGSWIASRCDILKIGFYLRRSRGRNQECWAKRSSENQTDGIECCFRCYGDWRLGLASGRLYWKGLRTGIAIGWSFRFYLRLRWSRFHKIKNVGVTSGIRWKSDRSDSYDFDSVELMTLLTTPIFSFHHVGIALTNMTWLRRWWKSVSTNKRGFTPAVMM